MSAFTEEGTSGLFDVLDTIRMTIRSSKPEVVSLFHGAAAEPGWNKVGVFQLGAGNVDLVVNGQSDGKVIVADAIRWLDLDGKASSMAPKRASSDGELNAIGTVRIEPVTH